MCIQTYNLFVPNRQPVARLNLDRVCGHCEVKGVLLCIGRTRENMRDCGNYQAQFECKQQYCGFCLIMQRMAGDSEEETVAGATTVTAGESMDQIQGCYDATSQGR